MFRHSDQNNSGQSDRKHGASPTSLRVYNERLMLGMLHRAGPLSAADLARSSGLSAQSVSVILGHLEAERLVLRGKPLRGRIGQPSVPLSINPDGAYALGAKIGRRSADVMLLGLDGKPRAHRWCAYPWPDPAELMPWLRVTAQELSATVPKIAGLGIALPSRLWDWAKTESPEHAAMQAWTPRTIAEGLTDLPFDVTVLNDGAAACAAEMTFGALPHGDDVIYLFVGTFIGGGLAQQGRLVLGPTGNAGSFGSVLVKGPDGTRQQLIEAASLIGLERALAAAGEDTAPFRNRSDRWDMAHPVLANWLSVAAEGIAEAVLSAVAVSDSRLVVIDGAMSVAVVAELVAQVDGHLGRIPSSGIDLPRVQAGTIGPLARVIGSGSVVLNNRFFAWPADMRRGEPVG